MSFMIIFISYVLQKAEDAISAFSKPTEKLHTIIQSFAKVFDLYKPHISVFYQESKYLKPHHVKIINEKRDCYRKIVYTVLEEGKQQAEFRLELPTSIIAMSILGIVNWTYKWYSKDGEYTIEEIANIFTNIISIKLDSRSKAESCLCSI